MTEYRIVTRHVRYWRGAIHKTSTVWPFTGTIAAGSYAAAIAAMYTAEQAVGYKQNSVTAGGVYEIALYNSSTGGVPVAVTTYFPWATPGSWIPYTGTGWYTSTPPADNNAETALQVEWPAGLSSSGKPVYFRKWFHMVPDDAFAPGVADLTTSQAGTLASVLHTGTSTVAGLGAPMGRAGRFAASAGTVALYFGNHQMPRGRRRKALVSSSGKVSFPASLLVVPGSDGSLGS